jgi:hypothetical protein
MSTDPSSMPVARDPLSLVTHNTFDIMAKLVFARCYLSGFKTDWGTQLYIQHLKVWNGLFEQSPKKVDEIDYLESFKKMLDDVRTGRFDYNKSPIPTRDGKLFNGRHRLAAAIACGMEAIPTEEGPWTEGREICDYLYLRNRKKRHPEGLTEKWSDAMAFEYCKLKANTFIATVFRKHEMEWVRSVIGKYGRIVYDKSVHLKNDAPFFLMREIYPREPWVGRPEQGYPGIRKKARLCYPAGESALGVYVIETDEPEGLKQCKEELRAAFQVGNHSVHINDRRDETIRIAKLLLNRNGIHFINNARFAWYEEFEEMSARYRSRLKLCPDSPLGEEFCIDGGSVLSLYGLRPAEDLDYLTSVKNFDFGHPKIHDHRGQLDFYPTHLHDILYNPENHFWYNNLKFASLDLVRKMKMRRGELKDKRDVAAIDGLNHPSLRRRVGTWLSGYLRSSFRRRA